MGVSSMSIKCLLHKGEVTSVSIVMIMCQRLCIYDRKAKIWSSLRLPPSGIEDFVLDDALSDRDDDHSVTSHSLEPPGLLEEELQLQTQGCSSRIRYTVKDENEHNQHII